MSTTRAIIQNGGAGKVWRVVCDEGPWLNGTDLAPFPLAYLAAGVAFCFMTQIGRYAQITKQKLNAYRIIQDTAYRLMRNDKPVPLAVETLMRRSGRLLKPKSAFTLHD